MYTLFVCIHMSMCVYTNTHTCIFSMMYIYTSMYAVIGLVLVGDSDCNSLQHTATHCNTLQHTAAHCNTLQHTAYIHIYVCHNRASSGGRQREQSSTGLSDRPYPPLAWDHMSPRPIFFVPPPPPLLSLPFAPAQKHKLNQKIHHSNIPSQPLVLTCHSSSKLYTFGCNVIRGWFARGYTWVVMRSWKF